LHGLEWTKLQESSGSQSFALNRLRANANAPPEIHPTLGGADLLGLIFRLSLELVTKQCLKV
jgi:hypothetical protein